MDLDRHEDQRSGRAREVLDRVNKLKDAFNRASSESEKTRLLQEMQKLNQNMHGILMDDIDDYVDYRDYERDNALLDAYEDDLIDYYGSEDDVDFDLDSDDLY
jgi:hypothetical protein